MRLRNDAYASPLNQHEIRIAAVGSHPMNATAPSAPIRPVGHSCQAATVRHAPLALWRAAQAFLGVLHMLFGAPETVAAKHTLTAKAHAQMASWLRSAEAMLRRLLLIEASAYPKPNTRPLLHTRRPRTKKLMTFSPDAPEAWRVRFRCFSSPALRQAQGSRELAQSSGLSLSKATRRERRTEYIGQPVKFRSAWPLAERYEALIRVFNDPAPYARRLSKRLHATPHRLREVLRAPPEAGHRVDHFEESGECAEQSWRPHFSSA
jgi:hypothetical protein